MTRPPPRVVALLLALSLSACAGAKTMLAPPDDLEDYRAFRVAAAPGTRLARAKTYLERHPKGAFANEVSAAFEEEEPKYFEEAQGTREGLRTYLAYLPQGPHADAALALLIALRSNMRDAELLDLARRVRLDDARLEAAAVQRRAVGDAILFAVGVFLDDDVYGIPREEAPAKLRTLLLGRGAPTWGHVPSHHDEDYFFILPTRPERESRLLTLEIQLGEDGGVVSGATLSASDMFVRWTEADQIVRLDADHDDDRTEAQIHAMGRLEGAFERRFPAATCPDVRARAGEPDELYHRACAGWEAIVRAGRRAGDKDAIVLRGPSPHARKTASP